MNLWETIQISWEGIATNKVRSFLTMLGIIIGVSAVIIMMGVSAGTEATIAEQISGLGSNLIMVQRAFGRGMGPGAFETTGLSYDDALAIGEEVVGINGAAAEGMGSSQAIRAGSTTIETNVLGAMPDYPVVRGVPLADGRFFTRKPNISANNAMMKAMYVFVERRHPPFFNGLESMNKENKEKTAM